MPSTDSKTSRLRKFIPQPERYAAQYGKMILTARDLEILNTVYRYRFVEARHIRALIPGSDQQITRRLQGLFHGRYLRRYTPWGRMRLDLHPGAPIIAYGLETKGARILSGYAAGDAPPLDRHKLARWNKAHTRRTEWFLEHCLMVSHFRCVLELAAGQSSGVSLIDWQQDVSRLGTVDGSRRTVRIAPDAYFAIGQPRGVRHFFLEADRSTEEHHRIVQKIERYWSYLQSAEYRAGHEEPGRVNVLFVTTGRQRMLNLLETLRQMPKPAGTGRSGGGKGWFWFCTADELSLEQPVNLFRPIWRTATATGGSHSLVVTT
jgi:hypothetical protein